MYDGAQKFGYGGGLDDSDMSFTANKQISKSTIFPQNNYLTAFPENAKAAPVVKIKVVVCFYSFAPHLLINVLLLAYLKCHNLSNFNSFYVTCRMQVRKRLLNKKELKYQKRKKIS